MRSRSLKYTEGYYTDKQWVYNYPPTVKSRLFTGDVQTSDELHSWPPAKAASGDVGGNFQSIRYSVDPGGLKLHEAHSNWSNPGGSAYNALGPQFARKWEQLYEPNHSSWDKTPLVSAASLLALGATAISRCAPTNPHASASQLLGELRRDGIPAIPGLKAFQNGPRPASLTPRGRFARQKAKATGKPVVRGKLTKTQVRRNLRKSAKISGSEHLNVVFGWKPLINDVRKLAKAQRRSEEILKQYVRDSGRLVRRHYEFPTTVSTTVVDLGLLAPINPFVLSLYAVPKGRATKTTVVTRRMWFDGAFTYHVNGGDDLLSRMHRYVQEANHLSGVGISPGVLWDLAPWSWAVDWFTNTGDVLNNMSMAMVDGLVVVYGYMMVETTTVSTYSNYGVVLKGRSGNQPPMSLEQTWTETTKQRLRATPFGFGVDLTALTPHQLAIVAALGLSRDGRKLAL